MKRTWKSVVRAISAKRKTSSSVKSRIATAFTLIGRTCFVGGDRLEAAKHLWQARRAG